MAWPAIRRNGGGSRDDVDVIIAALDGGVISITGNCTPSTVQEHGLRGLLHSVYLRIALSHPIQLQSQSCSSIDFQDTCVAFAQASYTNCPRLAP